MAIKTLAVKYRPHDWDSVVEQESIKIILREQLETNSIKNAYLFCGPAGCGKAQPLYSKLLTPEGYIEMRDVQIGTSVFTRNGNITTVTDIYPQGKRPIYEITLQDNTKIRVADNHLNSVYVYNQDKKKREDYVLTTLELIDFINTSKWKVRIDTPRIQFSSQRVLINPYLLGLLIGDGNLTKGNFGISNSEQDILDKLDFLLKRDYEMCLRYKGGYDYNICYITNPGHNGSKGDRGQHDLVRNFDVLTTLKGQLDYYKLSCKSTEKHIPKEYLLNSEDVRIQLLQGLYDSDGYTDKTGATFFSTSSKQLSEDFAFLVRSLGIRDTVTVRQGKYKNEEETIQCNPSYLHYLHCPKDLVCGTSEKHSLRLKPRQNEPIRNIISVDYIGEEECQCIMVQDEDHTYISDNFIPTHNTTAARIFANEINKGHGNPIEMDAASNSGVEDVRNISQQAKMKALDSEYKVYIIDECHSISNTGWQAFLKLIEEPPAKTIFIFATTDPQKIPKTILSRVQRYDFKRISEKGIVDRLEAIIAAEGENTPIEYDVSAIQYIAKLAEGGMRDAISLMDKAMSFSDELTLENVVKALGTVDYDVMKELTDKILDETGTAKAIQIIEEIHNSGKDIKQFINLYVHFLMDIQKYDLIGNFKYIQIPGTKANKEWLDTLDEQQMDNLYVLLTEMIKLNSNVKWSQTPKYDLEATILLFMLGE